MAAKITTIQVCRARFLNIAILKDLVPEGIPLKPTPHPSVWIIAVLKILITVYISAAHHFLRTP
jgi:hypothetical protein